MTTPAQALAAKTADAYSAARYASWPACAAYLLRAGFSEREAEAILRSKHTRWAADESRARYGRVSARDLQRYLERQADPAHFRTDAGYRLRTLAPGSRAVRVLIAETFDDAEAA